MDGCDSIGRSRNCSVNDCDTAKAAVCCNYPKTEIIFVLLFALQTLCPFITIELVDK